MTLLDAHKSFASFLKERFFSKEVAVFLEGFDLGTDFLRIVPSRNPKALVCSPNKGILWSALVDYGERLTLGEQLSDMNIPMELKPATDFQNILT